MDGLTSLDFMIDLPPWGFFPWESSSEKMGKQTGVTKFNSERQYKIQRHQKHQSLHSPLLEDQPPHHAPSQDDATPSPRQIRFSRLRENPLLLEYLTELEWLSREGFSLMSKTIRQRKTQDISYGASPQKETQPSCTLKRLHHLSLCYSVVDLCHFPHLLFDERHRKSRRKDSLNTFVTLPKLHKDSSNLIVQAFQTMSLKDLQDAVNTKQINQDTPAFLSSCFPVDPHHVNVSPSCWAETIGANDSPTSSSNVEAASSPFFFFYPPFSPTKRNLEKTQKKTLYSFLVNPCQYDSLSNFMQSLQIAESYKGVPSPLSPLPMDPFNESQQQGVTYRNGLQPTHIPRNRARHCFFHAHLHNALKDPKEGWFWDKSEPLGFPALCSCINEELCQVWESELHLHKQFCQDTPTTPRTFTGLEFVDWRAVIQDHDFTSFLKDITPLDTDPTNSHLSDPNKKSFINLHFCPSCGGLTYIPFSFIEVSLNQDISTLQTLARRLPLPLSTELFCDGGLRVTACLVTRCRLHEWLALRALAYINMESTVRVYQVCSMFVFPFHHLEKTLPATSTAHIPTPAPLSSNSGISNGFSMCSRHNLFHFDPSHMFKKNESPRLALVQHRRPYCLFRRPGLKVEDLNPHPSQESLEQPLKEACLAWLKENTSTSSYST